MYRICIFFYLCLNSPVCDKSYCAFLNRESSSSSSMWSSTKKWGRPSGIFSQERRAYRMTPARQRPLCSQWVNVLWHFCILPHFYHYIPLLVCFKVAFFSLFVWLLIVIFNQVIFLCVCSLLFFLHPFIPLYTSALSTATTLTQMTVHCTVRALASPPSPWTAHSGQPRAVTATWLTHSGTTRSLTAWLLLLHCWIGDICVFVHVRLLYVLLLLLQ